MEQSALSKFNFFAGYLLSIGVWTHNFSVGLKVGYAILAGVVMLLTLVNQWRIFYRSYHTFWIVVKIEHVITWFVPKKNRHRRNNFPNNKQQ
jgi:hypothetical protein